MAGKHELISRNQQGFTLIETLVSGSIAAIIAASVFVAFITYDRRARESVSFLKMQRQYDNVAERIAHDARSARTIHPAGEACVYPIIAGASITSTNISMFDETCTFIASYQINGDTLYEDANPFQAGGGAVALAAGSGFFLPATRNAVELRLALKSMDNDTTFTLPLRKDLFQCRQ
jgi:prepilin-type N-terminal cleavage/methylation domain-containing protein